MKSRFIYRLSEAQQILLDPEIAKERGTTDMPLTGAIYIGCYEEGDIVSLFFLYNHFVHFYVLKPFRRKAREYFRASEDLILAKKTFCAIPEERMVVINFAKKMGYSKINLIMGNVIMVKNYGFIGSCGDRSNYG